MPDTAFGLPTHPLVVHLAVVLVPLAAAALIAVGWNEAWRKVYYFPIALLSLAGAAGALLAKQSGEPLQQTLREAGKRAGDHPQQGDLAFVSAWLLAMACVALHVYHAYGERIRERLGVRDRYRLPFNEHMALYVAAVPVALLAVGLMVIAGHSGASLVWKTNK